MNRRSEMEAKRNNSKKRQAIYDYLCSVTDHPTAETVYAALKPDIPELSLGTVYRNLAVLTEEGQIISVGKVDGQERYDARTEPHAHFVCRGCRSVLDVFLPDVVSALYGEVDTRFGYLTEGHTLTLHGLCARCREK